MRVGSLMKMHVETLRFHMYNQGEWRRMVKAMLVIILVAEVMLSLPMEYKNDA